jgi:hypothetical protein
MNSKTIIIQSIGTAKPGVGKVLADVLGVSNEVVVKLLYCTPSILFQNVDEELAVKTYTLLTQLGLDVDITGADTPLPEPPALYDLAIFITDPAKLGKVNSQLAEFLGCTEQEALQLLLKDPAVVLGGVSQATAEALSRRIDAEVIMTTPQTDLYTIKINNTDKAVAAQLDAALKNAGLTMELKGRDAVEDVPYAASRQVWQRMQSTKGIEVYNQSFLRYQIILTAVDTSISNYRNVLTAEVGMPDDIIDEVLQNLPVVLNEWVNRSTLQALLEKYSAAGLQCSIEKIPFGDKKLVVDNITHTGQVQSILSQFYTGISITKGTTKWVSPVPISPVLSRLLTHQLQQTGCDVEIVNIV